MDRDVVRGWVAVALVAVGATVAQASGRFTYSVLLPAVRDDLGLSNSIAGFLGTVNVAAYLLGDTLVPVGVITGAFGAPFLIWLLISGRTGRRAS